MFVNDNRILLGVSIALRNKGFMVRRHFNEFFTFDDKGYVGIIIVGLTGDVVVYLPTWKKVLTSTKQRIINAIKEALGSEESKIKFIIPKLS